MSFVVETTLSSRGRLDLIRKAKSRGYEIHLVFIRMDSPERCITRIRNRAAMGGHLIPDADVRRRYARSVGRALPKSDLPRARNASVPFFRVFRLVRRRGARTRACRVGILADAWSSTSRDKLIPDRNLFRMVHNHNVAGTFLRIQLQTELLLDGMLKGRAFTSLRHGMSVIGRRASRG